LRGEIDGSTCGQKSNQKSSPPGITIVLALKLIIEFRRVDVFLLRKQEDALFMTPKALFQSLPPRTPLKVRSKAGNRYGIFLDKIHRRPADSFQKYPS